MTRETHTQPSAWRWYICAALFIATALNYLDRQVFSTLAPDLQFAIGWSELGSVVDGADPADQGGVEVGSGFGGVGVVGHGGVG